MATQTSIWTPFAHQHTIVLTTYRRDGTPVDTPVSIAVDRQRAFVRTWDTTGKMKRIRNNADVAVAPSTPLGRVTGSAIRARARVLDDTEAAVASRALARKYPILHGIVVPLIHRLRRNKTIHLELTPR
jgi:PPOX class probable F420-dependent enzyme